LLEIHEWMICGELIQNEQEPAIPDEEIVLFHLTSYREVGVEPHHEYSKMILYCEQEEQVD
jgi:hypothetical protein